MPKQNSLMKIEDFENLTYAAILANTTTRTQVLDSKLIRILEFTDKGAILQLPRTSCAQGHMLSIFVFPHQTEVKIKRLPSNNQIPNSVSFTAKVVAIEPMADPLIRVEVEFYQRVGGQWKKFSAELAQKQKIIDKLVKAIKE